MPVKKKANKLPNYDCDYVEASQCSINFKKMNATEIQPAISNQLCFDYKKILMKTMKKSEKMIILIVMLLTQKKLTKWRLSEDY